MKAIKVEGITTNNLKNLNISIPYNKVTAITGVSGGGKSSLAYNTLYSLCRQEFQSIEDGYFDDPEYEVQCATGLIPAVAIKQINKNINPRSTIYSYLNFYSLLSTAIDKKFCSIPYERLKLNKHQNECSSCSGLGIKNTVSEELIIDRQKRIRENPFRPWNKSNTDKHFKLFMAHCSAIGINTDKKFFDLTKKEQHELLFETSSESYSIRFKYSGKSRQKNLQYIGIIKEITDSLNSGKASLVKPSLVYCKKSTCPDCNGSRVSSTVYQNEYVDKIPFISFLTLSIDEVLEKLSSNIVSASASKKRLIGLLKTISSIGVGYLSLSRSIPSLSGGELQKINFSKLLNSNLSNILVVIDEISSQVHVSDYKKIAAGINKIKSRNNTIVLVEHNDFFVSFSDKIIFIGREAGKYGGYIINPVTHFLDYPCDRSEPHEILTFDNITKNNVKNISIEVPRFCITSIVGKSGAGKSSIADYISDNFQAVEYISQKNIKGNIRSSVASFLELNKPIALWFSDYFNTPYEMFFPAPDYPAACPNCNGSGVIKVERDFNNFIEICCNVCDGNLFSDQANSFVYNDLTISQLYSLTFDEVKNTINKISKLNTFVEVAINLGLGHLSLSRKTASLSGGELKRLKLLKSIIKKRGRHHLIVDEPGAGLDDTTASKVMKYISTIKSMYDSIIVIDHKPSIFMYSDHLIEIGPDSGLNGGEIIFQGNPDQYYKDRYLPFIE